MTKKYFQEVADIIASMKHVPDEHRKEMALHFANYFVKENDRFNIVKFIQACGFDQ